MGRRRKDKTLQMEEKKEVTMSQTETLESLETEIDKARVELEKVKVEMEEKRLAMQNMSSRVIEPDEQKIIDKQISKTSENDAAKELIEKQKAIDNQKVTGRFMNRRAPGQPAKLTYIKYADDPVKWYDFEDGKVYTIPRGFADQINEHYYTPHFVQKEGPMDPNLPANQIHHVDTSNKKYAFVAVNY